MPDQVSLYNQALGLTGSRSSVSSLTEASREREVCDLYYEEVRRTVLSAAFWPSARLFTRLALLKERDFSEDWVTGDPSPPFTYAYALPANMLRPRYIDNFSRFSVDLLSETQRALMTDQEDALLFYTFDQTNIGLWDSQLYSAIVNALAARISMPLHGKDRRAAGLLELAREQILSARAATANELEDMQTSHIPEWLQVRGYAEGATRFTYIYPYGQIYSLGSSLTSSSAIQNIPNAIQ